MTYEEYVYRKKVSEKRRMCQTNYVDIDATVYVTSQVWTGIVEPEQIVFVEQDDMDWLNE